MNVGELAGLTASNLPAEFHGSREPARAGSVIGALHAVLLVN
jgi:hypothetical protein